MTQMLTTKEVALRLRCSARTVTKTASKHGIGVNYGGSAGFRFTEDDVDRIRQTFAPVTAAEESA